MQELQQSTCLMLFSRVPVLGKVKTRLMPALGAAGALALHETLLQQKIDLLQRQQVATAQLWLDENIENEEHTFLDKCKLPIHIQQGGDLGARMAHAMLTALQSHAQALIIGTDCPDLDEAYVARAQAALLEGQRIVLGPALDGGYCLVGMQAPFVSIFEGISWGSASVLQQSLSVICDLGLNSCLLNALRDIDRPEDLKYFPNLYATL
jgi:uncharacterized protein